MRLCDLISRAPETKISGFAIDHRKVVEGNIFGAFKGATVNGEDYIEAAVERGAVAVVARPGVDTGAAWHIADDDPRARLAKIAARFYGPYPDTIVAVTGTNGKTSTVEMTRQIWRMAGQRAASIGTLGVTTGDDQVKTGLTTPDIVTFLSNMAGLKRMGITHVAYEASSHGLDQHRSEGIPVKAAAFTNFSRDHLDYHADMDDYFNVKMRLFDEVVKTGGTAVVWTDDERSDEVVARVKARGLKLMTVGKRGDTIRLGDRRSTPLGQSLSITHDGENHLLKLPLIGGYQAENVLVAAGLALAGGMEFSTIFPVLSRLSPVRGRLERAVITPKGAPVYVDYAHTPDALAAAVAALRPHVEGRLITVFGAGGDRDKGKRAAMGEVAATHSDVVIVTDDNPRSEDPAQIRREIMQGAPDAIEIDGRRDAIFAACREARAGDIILLAGKGHEQGQIVGDTTLPFDDVEVARECAA